jgi:hypothetical protein
MGLFNRKETQSKEKPESLQPGDPDKALQQELKADLKIILFVLFSAFMVSLIALAILAGMHVFLRGYALCFWALACTAVGVLLGFLFGIPRVLQKNSASDNQPDVAKKTTQRTSYHILVNTNLDDISDWLTKIVLGVSLIELQKIPGLLARIAQRIADEMGDKDLTSFIIAVIIYFAVVGFMTGYFATRLFVQRAFYIADIEAGERMERAEIVESTTNKVTVTRSGMSEKDIAAQ